MWPHCRQADVTLLTLNGAALGICYHAQTFDGNALSQAVLSSVLTYVSTYGTDRQLQPMPSLQADKCMNRSMYSAATQPD